MAAADPHSQPLFEMSRCAYRLGMVFGAEAEGAGDRASRVESFELFERCFFAYRVSVALQLRLRRTPAEPREAASDREALIDRADPPEREARDLAYTERDREGDREVERASFPLLVRTLQGVAADASARPGPQPAELPHLRELLDRVKARAQPAAEPPRAGPTLRARLTGSGAALAPQPRPKPHPASNVGDVLAIRRATGPPKRR